MSWRTVCITQRCKLEYRMGFLIIRVGNEIRQIHISEIGVLIIESTAISITSGLLNELNRNKTKIILCDELHNPYGEITPYYLAHDSSKAIKNQIKWDPNLKHELWKQIITQKILNQIKNLELLGHLKESKLLETYIDDILPGDTTNREGHAAKVYFNVIFGENFKRDNDSVINACLDYSYSLILAMFNREISSTGRITQLGIWHDNMFNHFNLSSDLMEPFRPIVDRFLLSINLSGEEVLDKELKAKLLKLLEEKALIDGKVQIMPNAIRIFCRKIFSILDSNQLSLLPKVDYV